MCRLSYIHKYSGKRTLSPSQRRLRLEPLNDLFSMAECCLMADTVQLEATNHFVSLYSSKNKCDCTINWTVLNMK
jgi:hypothetical protein